MACLSYIALALPASTLGLLWPSMRLSVHQPVAALGAFLVVGTAASVIASLAYQRFLARIAISVVAAGGAGAVSSALVLESLAPSFAVLLIGSALFSLGFGSLDTAVNAYGAQRFGPRQNNWAHAAYSLGAVLGPLLVANLLSAGTGWRWALAAVAVPPGCVSLLLLAYRARWRPLAVPPVAHVPATAAAAHGTAGGPASYAPGPEATPRQRALRRTAAPARFTSSTLPVTALVRLGAALAFCALETGAESAAGIWGFLYLVDARAMSTAGAGLVLSAYWATMFAGRAVLGQLAESLGALRVMSWAVVAVAAGAALMAVRGSTGLAVAGLLLIGTGCAPLFPLMNATTADRWASHGSRAVTRVASLQVAASTLGGAAVPVGAGLVLNAHHAGALAPVLVVATLAMTVAYVPVSRGPRRRPVP